MNRRDVLRIAGLSLLTPFVLKAGGQSLLPPPTGDDARWFAFDPAGDPYSVFDLSIASGDPTPSGVILWTRIKSDRYRTDRLLAFEVAQDSAFQAVVARGLVRPADFDGTKDFTVKLDLDGALGPDAFYYYRFIFDGVASRTGRCRTLPTPGASMAQLNLGIVTCQDYTNGYYAAFHHLAQEDLHFVLHMGDFIYETAGDPRFQSLPFADRTLILPSNQSAAMGLEDYRFLYRSYRADRQLQEALERHTFIHTWDDHETANDCYWDYDRNTLGAPDHPLTTQLGNDPNALRQLRMDAMKAWSEYVPARLQINTAATHPFAYFNLHRSFRFGTLAELFMTEVRSHRSPHPYGEKEIGGRYVAGDGSALEDPTRTMMGLEQREWLKTGVLGSAAKWKLWGNPVYSGVLKAGSITDLELYFDLDAWDGYMAERNLLMSSFHAGGVQNLLTFTGDLHTSLASYMKVNYWNPFNTWAPYNLVGVEFMTPSVTSASLQDLLYTALKVKNPTAEADVILDALTEDAVKLNNPHIKFFDTERHGYLVARITPTAAEGLWVSVDKNSRSSGKEIYKHLRVPSGTVRIDSL